MAPSCPSCPAEAEGAGDGLDLGSEPTVAPPEPPPPPAGASSPPKAGRGSVTEAVRAPPPPVPHVVHRTAEAARAALADKAGRGVPCGVDYETVGLDPRTGELRLVQVAEEGRPVDVVDVRACGGPGAVMDLVGRLDGVAHSALFELGWNRRHGVDANLHCTMIAARLVEGGRGADKPVRGGSDDDSGGLGLKALAHKHLGQVIEKRGWQDGDWGGELVEGHFDYAAGDAIAALRLWRLFRRRMDLDRSSGAYEAAHGAQPAVADMRERGVLLDREAHAALIADLRAEEVRHADELRRVAGVAKPSSPQQVGEWLEHELRGAAPALLAGWKRTAKGALVTSREELKLHVGEMPDGIAKLVAGVLLPYRAATTRVRFFGDKLAAAAEAGGGRAFPDFKVASTAAGRMSCADPNVQQIPREARFRRLFVAPPGRRLVVADYSQIELRAAVAFAREPTMLRLLADPAADLHRHTIHLLYGVPEGEVTPEQRQRAKTFNYGLIYSMGPATLRAKLAVQLGHVIPLDEAERLWARWFDAFAGFRRWHRERLRAARDEGVLRTVLGRPRRFAPGEVAPGVVFNHPVQGSCGEGLYVALALVRRRLREAGLDAVPIIAAHDEIVLEAAEADAAEAARILEEGMREGMLAVLPDLPALGLVEAHVGDSWADKK